MRWVREDIEKYEGQKEYIDTAIVPVFHLMLDEVSLQNVNRLDWLEEVCLYVEQQLMGRVMLFPTMLRYDESIDLSKLISQSFRYVIVAGLPEIKIDSALKEHSGIHLYQLEAAPESVDITNVVEEGKQLANMIMDQWKKT